jgi:hypothetical protein
MSHRCEPIVLPQCSDWYTPPQGYEGSTSLKSDDVAALARSHSGAEPSQVRQVRGVSRSHKHPGDNGTRQSALLAKVSHVRILDRVSFQLPS